MLMPDPGMKSFVLRSRRLVRTLNFRSVAGWVPRRCAVARPAAPPRLTPRLSQRPRQQILELTVYRAKFISRPALECTHSLGIYSQNEALFVQTRNL